MAENGNDAIVLARISNKHFIDIPSNAVVVRENKIKKTVHIVNETWGFCLGFPGIYFNTIINFKTEFTKVFGEERYNIVDASEVRVCPQVSFVITDPIKFYTQICGRDVSDTVNLNSMRMEGLYNVIKVAIRNIVVSCEFKFLETFSLKTMPNNGQYNPASFSQGPNDPLYRLVVSNLSGIEDTYGIKITKLGFGDITLNEQVQNARLEAEKAREDAISMKIRAQAKKDAAGLEKEALAIRIKGYVDAGLSPQDISNILLMEKTNGGTVIMGSGGPNAGDALLAQVLKNMNNNNSNNNNANTPQNGRSR